MADRNLPINLDLTKQINDLDISELPDDISSLAPDSTVNRGNQLFKSHTAFPTSTASRISKPVGFMNYGQRDTSGKKSPMSRAQMNRMTQNLVTTQKNYVQRRSTILEPQKQPIAPRDMWKNQDAEESDDSEKIKLKKKGRFRTVMKVEKAEDAAGECECEIFETELVDSDEPLSDESDKEEEDESRFDDTILTDADKTVLDEDGKKIKKPKPGELTFES